MEFAIDQKKVVKKVANSFGIKKNVYENWKDMMIDKNIDAIIIGTWPYMHSILTLEALKNNKHVLTEARMASNADEALEMLTASRQNPHLVCQVVPSPITFKVDKFMKKLIDEDYLGEILSINVKAYSGSKFIDESTEFTWRNDSDYSGLNIGMMGIFYEPLQRWVGDAKEVFANAKFFQNTRKFGSEKKTINIPDHLDIIANMYCGAQLNMQVSSVLGLTSTSEYILYGKKGTLRYDVNDGKLYGGRKSDSSTSLKEIDIPIELQSTWRVEEEFLEAILKKEKITRTSFEDGYRYMQFTSAVSKSISSREMVGIISKF